MVLRCRSVDFSGWRWHPGPFEVYGCRCGRLAGGSRGQAVWLAAWREFVEEVFLCNVSNALRVLSYLESSGVTQRGESDGFLHSVTSLTTVELCSIFQFLGQCSMCTQS